MLAFEFESGDFWLCLVAAVTVTCIGLLLLLRVLEPPLAEQCARDGGTMVYTAERHAYCYVHTHIPTNVSKLPD